MPVLTCTADDATLAAVEHIYDTVLAMGFIRRYRAQRRYEQAWAQDFARYEIAGQMVHEIGSAVGRHEQLLPVAGITAWTAMDELCGEVGGASDVADAVLNHDLIDPAWFDRLTRWWVQARLPLPITDPAVTAWDTHIGAAGGPLPGTRLTDRRWLHDGLEYTITGTVDADTARAAVGTIADAVRCPGARVCVAGPAGIVTRPRGAIRLQLLDDTLL